MYSGEVGGAQSNKGFESDPQLSAFTPKRSSDCVESIGHENSDNVIYISYKRRWIGLFVICVLNISTNIVWLTFAAVTGISKEWLNREETVVNLTSILYIMAYVVMSSFSGYAFEKWGIKKSLIFGAVLNCLGSWIRYFGSFVESKPDAYAGRLAIVLIGQFIAAAGQPFFLNAPPKFAAVWCSQSSRATTTMIGSVSSPLGAAVALFLIPSICQSAADMQMTLLIVAIIATVAMLPTLVTPEKPPTPPSASAQIALEEAADEPFWTSIKKISTNKNFWILFILFSIFVSFFNVFSSLINQIVIPYGYSDDDAGIFGVCLILAGFVGAGICGPLIDKTKKHQLVLKILLPLLAVSYIVFVFAVKKDFYAGICVVCAILGVWSFALLPVVLELGIECTYPVSPSSSVSSLWFGGQALSIIFLFAADSLRDESVGADPPKNLRYALIAMAVVACTSSAIVFLYNAPNRRMEAEKRKTNTDNTHKMQEFS